MYSRADLTLNDRLEIFSRYWRFSDDYGTVTRLAQEFKTSRRFVYQLAERVTEAMDWRRAGRKEIDQSADELVARTQRVRELEADCEQLTEQLTVERERAQTARLRLLLELALCPVSEDKIARCLEAAFGSQGRVSSGWVNAQIQQAGEAALAIMQRPALCSAVRQAALDEIFRHRQPILTVVDPQTMLALVPQAAENRKGETWKTVLAQYPQLEFVVSDQASGLLKGVQDCGRPIAHQYDIFHFKREINRWLRSQEAYCYEAMEKVEKARKLLDVPRLLSSARVQALVEYRQAAAALDRKLEAFDWIEVIVAYLEEHLSAYDARRHELRTPAQAEAMIAEVLGLLSEVEVINTKPLMTLIAGAQAGLFTFLSVLHEKLNGIQIQWRAIDGSRRAACNAIACAWSWRPRAHLSARSQRGYLTALTGLEYWQRRIENFAEVQRQVYEALDQVVRASSAVECLNSLLRPYISVKKHLSPGFLALIALYWDMRPLKQRGGKTPLELAGVDLGGDDWVALIEHELRTQPLPKAKAHAA